MRQVLKYIVRYLRLGYLFRKLRELLYVLFDFLGYTIFFILKVFHLLPKIEEFNKDSIRKVLIIRLDRIGDVILSTPAIRAVRSTFPEAEIHMLIAEYTKDLVVTNSNIDRLLIYGKDTLNKDYDLAIALHPGLRQNYLTFISGAEFRIGYTGWGGGFFLTHKLNDDREKRVRHEVESALEVVGVVGCKTEDKGLEISITEEGERFAEIFFQRNNLMSNNLIVVIHPGARQKYIRWEKEGFAEVANRFIKEENAKVILIGSKEEKQLVEETASLMEEKPLFTTGLRLIQLISLIKRSDLFIGNSTGPMHIAAALKVPVVAVFGPVHPLDSHKEWCPWGDGHTVVSKNLDCPECHPTDCKTFDCMKLVTVEDIMEAVKAQLGKIKKCRPKG